MLHTSFLITFRTLELTIRIRSQQFVADMASAGLTLTPSTQFSF